jgi:hypothetical protein
MERARSEQPKQFLRSTVRKHAEDSRISYIGIRKRLVGVCRIS